MLVSSPDRSLVESCQPFSNYIKSLQTFSIHFVHLMKWYDDRLRYPEDSIAGDYIEGDSRYYQRLWTPAYQVSNTRIPDVSSGKNIGSDYLSSSQHTVMVRIFPDGMVLVNKK